MPLMRHGEWSTIPSPGRQPSLREWLSLGFQDQGGSTSAAGWGWPGASHRHHWLRWFPRAAGNHFRHHARCQESGRENDWHRGARIIIDIAFIMLWNNEKNILEYVNERDCVASAYLLHVVPGRAWVEVSNIGCGYRKIMENSIGRAAGWASDCMHGCLPEWIVD